MLKFRHIKLTLVILGVSYYFLFYKKTKPAEVKIVPSSQEAEVVSKNETTTKLQDSSEDLNAASTPAPKIENTDETMHGASLKSLKK